MNIETFVDYVDRTEGNIVYNKIVMSPLRKVIIYVLACNPAFMDEQITVSLLPDPYNRWKLSSLVIDSEQLNTNNKTWWDEPIQLGTPSLNEFVNSYRQTLPIWASFAERFPHGLAVNAAMIPPIVYNGMEYMYDGSEITTPTAGISLISGKPVLITPLYEYGYLVDYIGEPILVVTRDVINFVAIRC